MLQSGLAKKDVCQREEMSFQTLLGDIGFRVQFNAEFPRQVMNFPIKSGRAISNWHRLDEADFFTSESNFRQFTDSQLLKICSLITSYPTTFNQVD